MANFGLRGLPGWPLPPPPLIEGVDRQVHRQARNWTKSIESPTSPESPPSVSGEQGHDTHLLPVPHQSKNYSPELTTVIRTSPLRKWSQENLLEQHDESSSDEDQARQQDGDEPASTPQPGGRESKVSFGLFEEKVEDEEEGRGEGGKARERRGRENVSGEENEQASTPVKKTLSLGGEGREDSQGAGVSVRREGEEEKADQVEGSTTDISISLAEGQEVLKVEVDQKGWRKGLYDYEGDVHNLEGAVVVDDVDVDGEYTLFIKGILIHYPSSTGYLTVTFPVLSITVYISAGASDHIHKALLCRYFSVGEISSLTFLPFLSLN